MNPSSFVTRKCAHQCCRSRIAAISQQPSTRFLSTSRPRSYAQPVNPPSSQASSDKPFQNTQSELDKSSPQSKKYAQSKRPREQDHPAPTQLFTGTISRTGTMRQTVQITRQNQMFDTFLQKHYTRPLRLKAHDPNPPMFLREGDVVEYSPYTQLEKDTKQAKDLARNEAMELKLTEQDKSGKMVRKFKRDLAKKKEMQGNKARGVQFVVRRVVTPFGIGIDERIEQLGLNNTEENSDDLEQPSSSEGGQDSLLRGLGGNMSRQTRSAAVAG